MARETMSIASGMKLFCMVDFVYNVDIDMAQCLERYDAPIYIVKRGAATKIDRRQGGSCFLLGFLVFVQASVED